MAVAACRGITVSTIRFAHCLQKLCTHEQFSNVGLLLMLSLGFSSFLIDHRQQLCFLFVR